MLNKRFVLVGMLFTLLIPRVLAQEAKFKALFMYNFTKYIEWPAEKQRGDFVIGVFGNSPIIQELEIIAQKKKVGTQNIVIRQFDNPAEARNCHMLYIPENRSNRADEIASACNGQGVVLITDKPGLGKTVAGLNYVQVRGKQSFEINKSNLDSQGVKVNSVLLSLGIVVD